MAANISVNFASEQDVIDSNVDSEFIRSKKSVSALLLQKILGGEVSTAGYVKKSGDTMTGFLTLTGIDPALPSHAATKKYVDTKAYTRRYFYECKDNTFSSGVVAPGSRALSGNDLYDNSLYFFDLGDNSSLQNIAKYIDVYRDGILQVPGVDYNLINNRPTTGVAGTSAIRFEEPFEIGSTFQLNIGSVGADPVTFGVESLSAGFGLRVLSMDGMTTMGTASGNLILHVAPSDFAASSETVRLSTERYEFVSPRTLSAYPLIPKAIGLFRKKLSPEWNTESLQKGPSEPYGSITGEFEVIDSKKVISVKSDPDNTGVSPTRFRVTFEPYIFNNPNYNALVNINSNNFDPSDSVFAVINSAVNTVSSFDFFVFDALGSPPRDVYEISILVF